MITGPVLTDARRAILEELQPLGVAVYDLKTYGKAVRDFDDTTLAHVVQRLIESWDSTWAPKPPELRRRCQRYAQARDAAVARKITREQRPGDPDPDGTPTCSVAEALYNLSLLSIEFPTFWRRGFRTKDASPKQLRKASDLYELTAVEVLGKGLLMWGFKNCVEQWGDLAELGQLEAIRTRAEQDSRELFKPNLALVPPEPAPEPEPVAPMYL